MNKTDVITQVSQKTGFSTDICEKAVKAFEDQSSDALLSKLKGNKNNRADLLAGIVEKSGLSTEDGETILTTLEEIIAGGLSDKLKIFK